jgi:hypothetical protein
MGWRAKFVFLLFVYAAGFVTAIYCLAPAPEKTPGTSRERRLAFKSLNSQEFARSVNSGVHKAIDLSKEAAQRAAQRIRAKIQEAQEKSDG